MVTNRARRNPAVFIEFKIFKLLRLKEDVQVIVQDILIIIRFTAVVLIYTYHRR